MLPELSKIKGIHPGAILKRELLTRSMKNKEIASAVEEHAQTISSILKEKRGINPSLSIKLGNVLGVDADYFMLLQASYEVTKAQKINTSPTPDLDFIRPALFWDTDFNKIDWLKEKSAVIKRIFERGNESEISEIISFYGRDTTELVLKGIQSDYLPSFKENVDKFFKMRS